jgi:polyisoprenoid-binding protein YceI
MEKLKDWSVDTAHSKVNFSVRHMVISEVTGHFNVYELKSESLNGNLENSSLEFSIDASSIDTGMSDRDKHLKSADFFDAEKYPRITFSSSEIKKIDDESYKVKGDLTIKNVTKHVELDVNYGGQIVDPWGNLRAGYNITGNINRFDFNLNWNNLIEAGGAIVGKNVKINIDIEIFKPKQ